MPRDIFLIYVGVLEEQSIQGKEYASDEGKRESKINPNSPFFSNIADNSLREMTFENIILRLEIAWFAAFS